MTGRGEAAWRGEAAGVAAVALRVELAVLAISALATGLPAAVVPRTFYDDFPFVASWVDRLPPYNEHLVTDVGAFYLAFALLFGWAAVRPARALVMPLCVAWALGAVLHLRFHVTHLAGFGTTDAIAEIGGLALLVLLPFAALAALRPA